MELSCGSWVVLASAGEIFLVVAYCLLPAIARSRRAFWHPAPCALATSDPHMSNKSKARKGPRLRPKQRMRF